MLKPFYRTTNILLYLLAMKPGVFHIWCRCLEKEKNNLLLLPGIKPQFLDVLTRSLLTTANELLRRPNKLPLI